MAGQGGDGLSIGQLLMIIVYFRCCFSFAFFGLFTVNVLIHIFYFCFWFSHTLNKLKTSSIQILFCLCY